MHPRIDLGLVLCAFGLHDTVRVSERSEFTRRTVRYARCLRCSRTPARRPGRQNLPEPAPRRKPSLYS